MVEYNVPLGTCRTICEFPIILQEQAVILTHSLVTKSKFGWMSKTYFTSYH